MKSSLSQTICTTLVLCIGVLPVQPQDTPDAVVDASFTSAELNPRTAALIAEKCVSCHGTDEQQGDLDLVSLPFELKDRTIRGLWIRIHDRVEHREMPPDRDDLTAEQRQELLDKLATSLHDADANDVAQSGRGPMRRLNRDI